MARREVNVSLTDVEVAGFLAMIEINLQESLIDPESVQKAEKLCDKLNAALNKFAQPEEDTIILYVLRRDVELLAKLADLGWGDKSSFPSPETQNHLRSLVTKLQGILRQGF